MGEFICIAVPIGKRVIGLCSRTPPYSDTGRFLSSLDPNYFLVASKSLAELDSGREQLLAATNIRMMRDQAAEMLFSLIGCAIQSPPGALLWLLSYRTNDLDWLLNALANKTPILTINGRRQLDWSDVARWLTRHWTSPELGAIEQYQTLYSAFWSRLSLEFTDPFVRKEYTSLKHGLRVVPGGVGSVTITPNDNSHPPVELSGSGFGTSYYIEERVDPSVPHHFCLTRRARNWSPNSLLIQLELIVRSTQSVIRYLRAANGEQSDGTFSEHIEEANFEKCWEIDGELDRLEHRSPLAIPNDRLPSEAELVALCERGTV